MTEPTMVTSLAEVAPEQTQLVAIDLLREYEDNPRFIRDERFHDLKYALAKDPSMLWARPLITDARTPAVRVVDGDAIDVPVIAGNMRLRAARELRDEGDDRFNGVPTFPKTFVSDAQRDEWAIRDNADYGDYVPDELEAIVKRHAEAGGDAKLLGLADDELAAITASANAATPPPSGGHGGEQPPQETWAIVVECDSEEHQAELLEELEGRDLNVRALL
jgi:hypothetical protein